MNDQSNTQPLAEDGFIQRPDGSYVRLADLEPRARLAHDCVVSFFPLAKQKSADLAAFKKTALADMRAYRDMMLTDYGVTVGGTEGNLTLRSVCGTKMMRLTIAKTVTFGPELEAAKALIDQFLDAELRKGGSDAIRAIVSKVFKLNSKGRLDTAGILGLQAHKFDDPTWARAMEAIEDAIIRDDAGAVYLNFYDVDPTTSPKTETLVPLDLAKV